MSDIEAIHALRTSFVAAFNTGDIEAMATHLTDDSVGMPPKKAPLVGLEANKADWVEGFSHGQPVFDTTSLDAEVAGDWAFDRFEWSMNMTSPDGGDTVIDRGMCMWINRRQADGSWKIFRSIWNSSQATSGPWA